MSTNTRNNIKGDKRPTDYEYALLSKHVYSVKDTTLEVGKKFTTPFRTWTICFVNAEGHGYFGAVYECEETKQYVVAHRGTNSVLDVFEDIVGVFKNYCSRQKKDAFRVVKLMVNKIRQSGNGYTLSFTGHSLGAFLAELSVYVCTVIFDFPDVNAVTFESPGSLESMYHVCWHVEESPHANMNNSLSRHNNGTSSRSNDEGNTTVRSKSSSDSEQGSDSSSVASTVASWVWTLSSHLPALSHSHVTHVTEDSTAFIKRLDIITYVCYPNVVNICNEHVGTLYAINVSMDQQKIKWPQRLISSHTIIGIVDWFEKAESGDERFVRLHMADWPKKYMESQVFFKYAIYEDGVLSVRSLVEPEGRGRVASVRHFLNRRRSSLMEHSKDIEKWFKRQKEKIKLKLHGSFEVIRSVPPNTALALHHFSKPMQEFLMYFEQKRNYIINMKDHSLFQEQVISFLTEVWKGFNMPDMVIQELLLYQIRSNEMDIETVFCHQENVHNFRREASCWLEKTGFTVEDLLNDSLIRENVREIGLL